VCSSEANGAVIKLFLEDYFQNHRKMEQQKKKFALRYWRRGKKNPVGAPVWRRFGSRLRCLSLLHVTGVGGELAPAGGEARWGWRGAGEPRPPGEEEEEEEDP